jgi:hypothetical protein
MKFRLVFSLWILAAVLVAPAPGQTPYKLPPKDVVAILDAPPPPMNRTGVFQRIRLKPSQTPLAGRG